MKTTDGPSPSGARRRRRHPALGARIAATGVSTATMLGIVAGLGANPSPGADSVDPRAAAPVSAPGAGASSLTVLSRSDRPVVLTATPTISVEPTSGIAAPVARTHGSR